MKEEIPPLIGVVPKYIIINSRLLNETIGLVFNKNDVKTVRRQHPEMVIYLPPEIDKIHHLKGNGDAIRKAHAIKKQFTGWIV